MVFFPSVILVLSGLIGVLEGRFRSCGPIGGFFMGLFPLIGWIMVSVFPWKGEVLDSWTKGTIPVTNKKNVNIAYKTTTPIQWFIKCFRHYFDFHGRAGRREFWWYTLINFVMGAILVLMNLLLHSAIFAYIYYVYAAVILVPSLAVSIRRIHDTGYNGWGLLAVFVFMCLLASLGIWVKTIGFITLIFSFAVLVAYLVQMSIDSEAGVNKWGTNPKELSAVE